MKQNAQLSKFWMSSQSMIYWYGPVVLSTDIIMSFTEVVQVRQKSWEKCCVNNVDL